MALFGELLLIVERQRLSATWAFCNRNLLASLAKLTAQDVIPCY